VWNLCGSVAIAFLLAVVLRAHCSRSVALVAAWWLYEEALTSLCTAGRMIAWWYVGAGREQCSEKIGMHLGAISLVIIGALAASIQEKRRR
jgi:hypothetical protein